MKDYLEETMNQIDEKCLKYARGKMPSQIEAMNLAVQIQRNALIMQQNNILKRAFLDIGGYEKDATHIRPLEKIAIELADITKNTAFLEYLEDAPIK